MRIFCLYGTRNFSKLLFMALACAMGVVIQCRGPEKSEVVWTLDLPVTGSQSSPRAADLNRDGYLDFVMGAGKNEYQASDQGVIAFDGKTGKILWQQKATDQVYGSATFYDVTGDDVPDVFIGGRSTQLKAIDGATGTLLWAFEPARHASDPLLRYARFNFNNAALVPDQDGDGLQDLVTVNGGNSRAEPYSAKGRFPAVLMIFSARTGSVIAADTMPDGRESYMSPVSFIQPGTAEPLILFGTGGETIGGNLYLAALSDLKQGKLSRARIIASDSLHGFIAPPVLADLSGDGHLEAVAISHGSQVFALNLRDRQTLWRRDFPGTECSNSFAVGRFTPDEVPDVFTFTSKGAWPNSTGSLQVMLDGRDGHIAFMDSIGCTGFSSPVVYDLNGDGVDEAIISLNEFDCSLGYAGKSPSTMMNRLVAIDFRQGRVTTIDQQSRFKNIFSTPWIGDVEDDGYLDIVHCQYFHDGDILSFLGMRVKRITTPVEIRKPVIWGAYLGSDGTAVFPANL